MKQEKNRKKNKIFTPIIAFHFLDNVQADLVDISRISEDNNNIKFLLCIIDVFSRYSGVYLLLNIIRGKYTWRQQTNINI